MAGERKRRALADQAIRRGCAPRERKGQIWSVASPRRRRRPRRCYPSSSGCSSRSPSRRGVAAGARTAVGHAHEPPATEQVNTARVFPFTASRPSAPMARARSHPRLAAGRRRAGAWRSAFSRPRPRGFGAVAGQSSLPSAGEGRVCDFGKPRGGWSRKGSLRRVRV